MKTNHRYIRRLKLTDYELRVAINALNAHRIKQKNRGVDNSAKEIAIRYDGNVYPCTEAREHDEYAMGNITDMSLRKVIELYEANDANKLSCKELLPEECVLCKARDICNKGCRLRSKHFFGDFNAPDPFNCRIFNDEFPDVPIGKLFWGMKD